MNPLEHLKSVLCDTTGKCCISGSDEDRAIVDRALLALAEQPAQQEPVAKPYAYEYGRVNVDGTYSVVIEKGDLVQTAPAVYNYVRPRNAHKDWPIKELFDCPQANRKPLTNEEVWTAIRPLTTSNEVCTALIKVSIDEYRAIEAAHGIKEKNNG